MDVLEQAMVVAFPQEDPKVCQVSFRLGVPLLVLQAASLDSGRMSLGDRQNLDLRKACAVAADGEKVSILSRAGGQQHLMVELHMDDNAEIQTWTRALRSAIPENAKARAPDKAPERIPKDEAKDEESSEHADEECSLLRAKSQKLQQRISTLEALSGRREKQMKRLLKRLDGAMQMLEALEDMCGQQRKVISAQQLAISALKEEGAVDDEEEEEEDEEEAAEHGDGGETPQEDVSDEKLMALFQQAEQMECALKQIEALGQAGLLSDPPSDGDGVESILSRLRALEEEKANFERMVAQSK